MIMMVYSQKWPTPNIINSSSVVAVKYNKIVVLRCIQFKIYTYVICLEKSIFRYI